jgi:hypothetical protein
VTSGEFLALTATTIAPIVANAWQTPAIGVDTADDKSFFYFQFNGNTVALPH